MCKEEEEKKNKAFDDILDTVGLEVKETIVLPSDVCGESTIDNYFDVKTKKVFLQTTEEVILDIPWDHVQEDMLREIKRREIYKNVDVKDCT
jgi:phosphatidate phosphatase PAH1